MRLNEILSYLPKNDMENVAIVGNDNIDIVGLNLCNRISEKSRVMAYVTSDKYLDSVKQGKHIVCLIVNRDILDVYKNELVQRNGCVITCEKPEIFFYKIHEALCRCGKFYNNYSFVSIIGRDCKIDKTVVIEPGVVIGNRVTIGPNTVVRSGSVIDDDTTIGCNTTIGSEGFQLITDGDNAPMHITHVGKCHLCSNVYVGDNTCICNSLFEGETIVESGAKIDNLVHIAHNLYVGKNAVVTAHVITCGSSVIEDGAWIGPNSSILNRVVVGKCAKVGLGSVVTRDVPPYSLVYGSPAKVHDKH